MDKKVEIIETAAQMRQLAKRLGVRHDWHEPDEQGLTVRLVGRTFDNAAVEGEKVLHILKYGKVVAVVNLATLCAIASGYTGEGQEG